MSDTSNFQNDFNKQNKKAKTTMGIGLGLIIGLWLFVFLYGQHVMSENAKNESAASQTENAANTVDTSNSVEKFTVHNLLSEYEKNPYRFGKNYLNKDIEISGAISEIDESGKYVVLEKSIYLYVPQSIPDAAQKALLEKIEKISVKENFCAVGNLYHINDDTFRLTLLEIRDLATSDSPVAATNASTDKSENSAP